MSQGVTQVVSGSLPPDMSATCIGEVDDSVIFTKARRKHIFDQGHL